MQPGTVPRIPQRLGFEHRHRRTVACLLLGGQAQAATTAMAFEIAASHSARLMAIAAVDPFAPVPSSTFSRSLWSLMDDVDFKDMRASARSAVQQFEPQGREGLLMVSRVIGGPDIRELTAKAAEADLVLVPANVAIDGSWAAIQSEVAEFLARRSHAPILRISRRPLDVRKVVLIISNTRRCSQLAHRYLEAGLWPEASISMLPIGEDRPRVLENVKKQLDLLQTSGRDTALLPSIDLDFEAADLQQVLSPFQAAIMGYFNHSAGWFDAVRWDPFEVATSCVPVALLP